MFESIKSIFLTDDDESKSKKKTITPTNKPKDGEGNRIIKVGKETTPLPKVVDTHQAIEGKINNKFLNILFDALEKNNLEGFDYFEFKKSLQALEKMPMDEATRYRSAYAMASSMGVTAPSLVQTAGHYLKILDAEGQKFQQALAQQNNAGVGGKQSSLKKLETIVQQKAEQITKLTQDITALQKEIETTKQTIAKTSTRILQTKSDFDKSYEHLKGQIDNDVTKMKEYLMPKKEVPKSEPKQK